MQTASSSYWNGLRDSLTQLAIDYGRARYVDVETRHDDQYLPDQADLRYGGGLLDERGLRITHVVAIVLAVAAVGAGAYLLLRR